MGCILMRYWGILLRAKGRGCCRDTQGIAHALIWKRLVVKFFEDIVPRGERSSTIIKLICPGSAS